jgi:hypothetical protein
MSRRESVTTLADVCRAMRNEKNEDKYNKNVACFFVCLI